MGGIFSAPKGPPPPPSPEEQARAQQVTQLTPQGNLIYGTYENGEFVPSSGHTAAMVEQTPYQQQIQGIAEALGLNLGQQFQQQFGEQGLTNLMTDFSQDASRLEDATYQAGLSRMQPQFDQQREQITQQLADQGIPMGSPAYEEEMRRLEENQNEQLSRLALDSVAMGRQEQSRLANLAAQTRAQQFGEVGSLLGFAPPFQPQPVSGYDTGYGNQMAYYNAQQGARQGQASNLMGLASLGAFAISDRSVKDNIRKVGKQNGHNVYEFTFKGSDKLCRGVMADEVERIMPKAVKVINGLKHVNYKMIGVDYAYGC